jgi:hypothetical protein
MSKITTGFADVDFLSVIVVVFAGFVVVFSAWSN